MTKKPKPYSPPDGRMVGRTIAEWRSWMADLAKGQDVQLLYAELDDLLLTAEIERNSGEAARREANDMRARADAAEKDRQATREKFTLLKERLYAVELLNARREGYERRVREDDHARDGFIQVETSDGPVMRPRRQLEDTVNPNLPPDSLQVGEKPSGYGRPDTRPRVHWVNF